MGLFSWVQVPDELLPVEARGLTGWQTKDVIKPAMARLVITAEGDLLKEWWEYEREDAPDSPFGFRFRRTMQHLDPLSYHGDMVFYTGTDDPNVSTWQLIECRARFDDGKLREIAYLGPFDLEGTP